LEEVPMSVDRVPLSALAVAPVHSVRPSDSARKAIALMKEFSVDQLPEIEPGDRLCGVVTWRRVSLERRDWGEVAVSELAADISADRVRPADTPLGEVFDLLFERDFVLISEDEGYTVAAIATINDVARYLYENAD